MSKQRDRGGNSEHKQNRLGRMGIAVKWRGILGNEVDRWCLKETSDDSNARLGSLLSLDGSFRGREKPRCNGTRRKNKAQSRVCKSVARRCMARSFASIDRVALARFEIFQRYEQRGGKSGSPYASERASRRDVASLKHLWREGIDSVGFRGVNRLVPGSQKLALEVIKGDKGPGNFVLASIHFSFAQLPDDWFISRGSCVAAIEISALFNYSGPVVDGTLQFSVVHALNFLLEIASICFERLRNFYFWHKCYRVTAGGSGDCILSVSILLEEIKGEICDIDECLNWDTALGDFPSFRKHEIALWVGVQRSLR